MNSETGSDALRLSMQFLAFDLDKSLAVILDSLPPRHAEANLVAIVQV